jgi:hypothetical protein
MNVRAALEQNVKAGTIPALDELGGVEKILADWEAIIASPFLDVFVESVGRAADEEQAALVDLLAEGFRTIDKPIVFRDAANALLNHRDLTKAIRRKLEDVLADRVEERRDGANALTAAYALETLFRLGLEDRGAKLRALRLIEDIKTDDNGLFVRHATRIVGIAYHQWEDRDLREVLIRLQANEEATDEATFELAMIGFADALNANSRSEIETRMKDARALFKSVLRRDEQRLDAATHITVIDIVLSFSVGLPRNLSDKIENLGRLLAERHDQLGIGETPSWLKPRIDREVEWWALLRLMRSVDSDIRRESWLEASLVMEQVLVVYDAERTVAVGTSLNMLFAPRIEAAFIRHQGLAAHLHDLLATEDWAPPERPIAMSLRDRIAQRAKEGFPTRLDEEDGAYPELSAVLHDHRLLSQVPEGMASQLESALTDRTKSSRGRMRPDVQRICRETAETLADAEDYRGEVSLAFDELLKQIVVFCEDRQSADMAQLGERGKYLRSANAIENDLQRDLREWLRGNMPAVGVFPEVPGIAIGRSDLYVDFGEIQFVVELKCHHGVVNESVARKYRAQAVAYQATGPKLGMLGILELTDRPGPPPSLIECVWVDSYVPKGSSLPRFLVVFRVPGMLKRPSEMK